MFLLVCSIFGNVSAEEAVQKATENSDALSGRMLVSDFQSPDVHWYDASGGKMKLETIPEGLKVSTDFANNPVARLSVDAHVSLDLTNWNRFEIETNIDSHDAFSSSSLYFHSGGGWYSCGSSVPEGNGKITFRKSDFNSEGSPAGWDKIDTVRFSLWRMGEKESSIVLSSFSCAMEPVLFVSILNPEGVELWIGANNASILSKQLKNVGIESDQCVMPKEASAEMWDKILSRRFAVIVNHVRHMKPETRALLERWASEKHAVLMFLDGDLRENPIETDALLTQFAQSSALKSLIVKNCLRHASTMMDAEVSNAAEITAAAQKVFDEDGVPAGVQYCEVKHAQNLQKAALKTDPDGSMKFRAWWNHDGLGAYLGDWARTAKELRAAGFTAVIPNMLWVGSTLFPSKYAPTSELYEKYGDQMKQCIDACHAEGIEVHVWRVCFNGKSHIQPELLEKYRTENRLQKDRNGETIPWLCPSNPENIETEVGAMMELADNYDVDGVHFDYIRYESGCYCDGCRARFEKETGAKIENWPSDVLNGPQEEAFHEWRAAQITNIVKRVHDQMREKHPNVKLSAAVFSSYPSCRESVGQDWALWAREGYVDFLCPMNYTQDARTFRTLSAFQQTLVPEGFPLYFGIGEWRVTPDGTVQQIQCADEIDAKGFTIFNLTESAAGRILPLFTK